MSEAQKQNWYVRFTIFERIEHLVLILSFTLLALTGLPQKYALNPISQAIINLLGGIEVIRVIHHISAAVFLLEAVYHLIAVGYKLLIQNKKATMLPVVKDAIDAVQSFGYNLGFVKKPPKMPRYNFMEKAEYWALVWGLVVMAITGLMLWNPIFVTRLLPGEFIPAAKAAHGGEAVLAVLAIILWHFYNVHIKHWNWSMIRGVISHHEMVEEHAEELEQIQAGALPVPPAPEVARRRMMVFAPAAAVVTLLLAGAVYYALTFESTSVTTLPPSERVPIYVLATLTAAPPTPTALPQVPPPGSNVVFYAGGIDEMLKTKCSSCHGRAGGFNVGSYENVMKAVQAGSPENSKIIDVQKTGIHPGQLTHDELSILTDWVQTGAYEKEGGQGQAAGGAETWSSGIAGLFKTKCGACHGSTGGFTATTYNDVMKQVKAGDPDNSNLVVVQKKGGHPGQFSAADLDRIVNWIKVGAPEQ